MDIQILYDCFQSTLQPDQVIREQAELQLRQLQSSPAFLGGCLDIIINLKNNSHVQKAAVIYFKNIITRQWSNEEVEIGGIDRDAKPLIKERLISALVESDYHLKTQLCAALCTIINADYPSQWPELLTISRELIGSGDISRVHAGLLCLVEIARSFRWKTNDDRPTLDPILKDYCEVLLTVGEQLLSSDDFEAGDMVKLILKFYKFVTYHDLPLFLQSQDMVVRWCTLHVNVINKKLGPQVLALDESERKLHSWVKCQKWSVANLYRLFSRYGSKALTRKFSYDSFREMFVVSFVPSLLPVYYSLIGQWCKKDLWLSGDCIYYMLEFLSACVLQKKTWALVKPHVETLLEHFIFPLLCPSDNTLELFENDPQEYIHTAFEIYDSISPDIAATSLLVTLVDTRRKSTLDTVLQFAYNKIAALCQEDEEKLEVAKQKEGILRIIGSISHNLTSTKSPYHSQMEDFLATYIFPNFNSKFSFLRARTCETASNFSELEFQNKANLASLYHGVLTSFDDSNLPTQLKAALALQLFITLPDFQDALSHIILPTMQKLLELSNRIDNENISGVMQACVEVFSVQLQPFGIDLMTKLVDQFMRIAIELNDAAQVTIDDVENGVGIDDNMEKQSAAIGLLDTMITVLLSFENSMDVCMNLEQVFDPVIKYVFVHDLEDYFGQIGDLIENSTFLIRNISPIMWGNFELILKSFQSGSALLYLDELLPCLNNFLVYGQEELKKNQSLSEAFVQLFKCIIDGDESQVGSNEIAAAAELAQTFILSLQTYSTPYIPQFISDIIKELQSIDPIHIRNISNDVNLINLIISGLVYDCDNVLNALSYEKLLNHVFECWFNLIPNLSRVYDIKLSILGVLALAKQGSPLVMNEQILGVVGSKLVILLRRLPDALSNLEKKRKNFDADDFKSQHDFNHLDDWADEEIEETQDAENDNANADDYLEFLLQESMKLKSAGFYDESDFEEISEDALSSTPLDSVNAFEVFHNTLVELQSRSPSKYQALLGALTEDDKNVLRSSAERATQ